MNLHSLVIELGAASEKPIPATLNRAIHSQFMAWLSLGNPHIAKSVHDSQESPFSLSGLIGYRRLHGTRLGDNFIIRISLLDDNLIDPLLQGIELSQNQSLYLGNFPFVIRGISTFPGSHSLVNVSDYCILANTNDFNSEIVLNFVSPTSFKQHQNIQPFPLPELVFNSLLRRWNHFAPSDLHFPEIKWQGLVSAFNLKTHALKMEAGAEIGSVGWVKYRFLDSEQARIATILSHFAVFSGVGRKTTMGMGQINSKVKSQKSKLN
ncbi:CRISPR-associated endoribonuclease Cas6 [Sphaerospermopsis kisseleviana CS-549]|uniref:CRISPR-associated Cas5e family protein n=2 Tax=Sphaerospermopsis TaxID=752201 RepID=A0A479ZZM5_9CYAN|nr:MULTISPECIES: CRISPR-associated endoribonuclease Cas6 [Sphaerospermopsis]MDB9443266.1 CRISPR-associated endoribonuclease Cas6 [Sphaerospermopsis kisseleviana CS-549]BAZ80998.1 CRISPR-associated Cas5e family protein [Sphaerospermopsis kisseleviana NIES-73]GCL38260.1 CRISPR-associated Cas5e family protein [Sphaerospermopsis reniformis]